MFSTDVKRGEALKAMYYMDNSLDISKITNPNASVLTVNHSNNENPLTASPNVRTEQLLYAPNEPQNKDNNVSGNILRNTTDEDLDNPEMDEEE